MSATAAALPPESWPKAIRRGLRAKPSIFMLIAALNTAIALLIWVEDPRPFWHPFVSVQISGFAIAYCVNVAAPWDRSNPIWRLIAAVAVGSAIALVLIVLVKQYDLAHVTTRWRSFMGNFFSSFFLGLMVSLFFLLREREARARAAMLRAEAERNLLARQAVEAELKLMQAQIEPHFLFNTLASVQFLTETDPPRAGKLLGHLIEYLRAALPDLRASLTTIGRETDLAKAYLEILAIRMGPRLAFDVDIPADLRAHPFPPNMLVSLVENAIKHGLEPSAEGGRLSIAARRAGESVEVTVTDTGRGLAASSGGATKGHGVGLTNLRERLAALYGARARFVIDDVAPGGTRAVVAIPFEQG
ncbi:MAG: histidine kinase [Betaproteobacteria bacterium]|jgi:sensor histidine kinase YesM|nr:histidine kinase [Betaproteobacteria bacterium]